MKGPYHEVEYGGLGGGSRWGLPMLWERPSTTPKAGKRESGIVESLIGPESAGTADVKIVAAGGSRSTRHLGGTGKGEC